MIITASHTFRGMLDLSANPTLEDLNELEALPFHLTMKSGQVITVDDKFYSLRNIQGAIKAGYITVKLSNIVQVFTDLKDVPSSYTGNHDRLVKVKSNEEGLDFTVRLSVGTVAPSNPSIGDLWVDTN